MQRPTHRVAGSYRVIFSPRAWSLIGVMPAAAFQSLQLALERLADSPRWTAADAQRPLRATLDGVTVVYELDETERTLTVVDIT